MTEIIGTSPTRVDLAGGTLDLWPLYLFHSNCVTVNLAIDIYTRATLRPRSDSKINLRSKDTGQERSYKNLKELTADVNDDLKLLKVHCEFWKPKKGFDLTTESESPIGGGIAGSSSLNISLCGVFSKFTGLKFSKPELIRLAGNLEAQVLKTPTGCQDYFPPVYGGLSLVELTPLGPQHTPVKMNLKAIADRLTLVYTGKPHHSGLNNWQIFKSHVEKTGNIYDKMERIKNVALEMKQACLKKDSTKFGGIFNLEYDARIDLSPVFTSPEIERLKALGVRFGAEAIKICGAGGGGCVFLWSAPGKKKYPRKRMQTRRISGATRQARGGWSRSQNNLKALKFLGLHLGGGKSDRTTLVVISFFENQNKLFLTNVYEHIQAEDETSSDDILFQIIKEHSKEGIHSLSIDAPLKFPICIDGTKSGRSYEACVEKEMAWMWKEYRKQKRKKPRLKIFTPYTQRAVEQYLTYEMEGDLAPLEALGANTAPMAARARYLIKHFPKINYNEAHPGLSILRIGQSVKTPKSHLLHYKHQVGGEESRQIILDHLLKKDFIFIYQQDYHRLINNSDVFEALFCALTGFLKHKGLCEKPPKDFPLRQGWIEFPQKDLEIF